MIWYPNSEARFGATGAKGDLGEAIVKEYCEKNGMLHEAKTDVHSQVNLKIDCLINGVPVDVKSNYIKGYLAIELYVKGKGPGWIFTTTAKQIYGVDVETKSIYRYNVEDMIEYITNVKPIVKKTKKGDVIFYIHVMNELIERLQ